MTNLDPNALTDDLADATRILVAHTLSRLRGAAAEQVNRVHEAGGCIQTRYCIEPGGVNARICLLNAAGDLVAELLSAGLGNPLARDAGIAAAQVTAEVVRQLPAHMQLPLVDAVFEVHVALRPHDGYSIVVLTEYPDSAALIELATIIAASEPVQ